mmetsp:Transcript_3910/g.4480  ORF Transcript_3910/g.4480 Transcript_3910/m.4480 type:complete len:434 (+) Transcript_3910:212-1513(+)
MDFNAVKERVEKARIKAASVATKLSLNEMAKQDEYIHSDGLNVVTKTTPTATRTKAKHDTSSTNYDPSSSFLNTRNKTGMGKITASPWKKDDNYHKNANNGNTNVNNREQQHHLKSFDHNQREDDDSDNDSLHNDDPILQMMKLEQRNTNTTKVGARTANTAFRPTRSNQYFPPSTATTTTTSREDAHNMPISDAQTPTSTCITPSKGKDPNRFMADLDARLALPINDTMSSSSSSASFTHEYSQSALPSSSSSEMQQQQHPYQIQSSTQHQQQQQQQQQETNNNILQSFANSDNKMNWLRNVASPKIQQSIEKIIQQVPTSTKYKPVHNNEHDIEMCTSSKTQQQQQKQPKIIKTLNGEDIHVTAFTSLGLGENENAELQRIQQQMNKSNSYLSIGFDLLVKHKYYFVIVMTFIFTMFGYFYTRNKTDNSVT